ncbi:hypothetical protein ACFU7T_19075 [Streptomyces sp. NPDC057555]|uniref:hypothetical protein n=1 Tax=Streptomyces sp. NPDC057555 TaxID=3346166 RepID=UPI00369D0699
MTIETVRFVSLYVIVPRLLAENRLIWEPVSSRRLPSPVARERVAACGDVAELLKVHGRVVAQLLSTGGKFDGFRLVVRCSETDALVGHAEWYISPETGAYLPYPGGPWDACDYGQHHHATGQALAA